MAHGYTRQYTLLDGTSANSSVRTSTPVYIGDAEIISLSYVTAVNAASVLSVDVSLSDGFTTTLSTAAAPNGDWIRFLSVAGNAVQTFSTNTQAGPRWVRVIRAATDSQASVQLTTRNY